MIRASILLCALFAWSPALAGPSERDREAAKAAFDRAQHHYNLGDFERALTLFKEAYDAAPLADLLFNIAQCHRNLGQDGDAIFFFERYLSEKPSAADGEKVRRLLSELRSRERLRPPPPVETSSTPATIAPTPVEIAPTPVEIPPAVPPPELRSSIATEWWFWTAIVVGAAAIAGGAVLAVRGAGGDDLPQDPIATFDYRDL